MKDKIDTIDLMILRELRNDCKRPMRELAQKLKMHPNTLLQRIKKLESSKFIRGYQADIDYSAVGYDIQGVIIMKVKSSQLENEEVLNDLAKLPEIVALYSVTGGIDCMAIFKVRTRESLLVLLKHIQASQAILRTNTYHILYTHKGPSCFNPLVDIISEKREKR
ncbi:Lrp/AsnC family transcriptional regulator [Candidatus Micrarchaeota archaeon]|nr:Lrp/AsnC family transcriptional regulator [Candidatus Micrarchaeota archaeon]MBU1165407.1 Lrp/AsnC family transcriptional regulator [Candidatus Micrarchaeota archaeon]MBU1886271.1 Lrp/AsnC family transcriptional regulator [Candidatus Micrarchaeota archaeon]